MILKRQTEDRQKHKRLIESFWLQIFKSGTERMVINLRNKMKKFLLDDQESDCQLSTSDELNFYFFLPNWMDEAPPPQLLPLPTFGNEFQDIVFTDSNFK